MLEICAHVGMKGVSVYGELPLQMLTFARPARLNDLRVGDSKLLRNVDCFYCLLVLLQIVSGEGISERSEGYKV